jgi:hypothetical protein
MSKTYNSFVKLLYSVWQDMQKQQRVKFLSTALLILRSIKNSAIVLLRPRDLVWTGSKKVSNGKSHYM